MNIPKRKVKELSHAAQRVIDKYKSRTTREAYIAKGILKPIISTDANGNHTYDDDMPFARNA